MSDAYVVVPAGREEPHTNRDLRLASLAARQQGVVAHRQLLGLGFSSSTIHRLVARGRLHRLHRGVFAVGHPVLGVEGRLFAAVLASGDGAVVSHRSAAALWDLRSSSRSAIDIVTARGGLYPLAGIDRHVARGLAEADITAHRGVPVTTPSRTLADIAAVLRPDDLRRTLERADTLHVLDAGLLLRSMANRPGGRNVRRILAEWAPAPTRSELEDRLLALVRRAGFPEPEVNRPAHGFEIDLRWPSRRLAVEADGRGFHSSRGAMERDRHRDAVLVAEGYQVLRFTWRQVTRLPAEVIRALEATLHR